jgi:YggT family protein
MSEDETRQDENGYDAAVHEAAHEAAAQEAAERRRRLIKATRIIRLITSILEALIGMRFFLKLIAANPQAGFAQFIYDVTAVFLVPFQGLTATPSAGGSVLELWSLIAMFVYALLAWGTIRTLWILFDKPVQDF